MEQLFELASGLIPYGLVALLSLLVAVATSFMLAMGREVPVVAAAAGPALAALGGALVAAYTMYTAGNAQGEEVFQAVQLATTVRFSGWFGLAFIGFVTLAILAVAGARRTPRDTRAAAVTGGLVVLVVGLTALSGWMNSEYNAGAFYYLRAGEYLVLGGLCSLAMLSGGEPTEGGRTVGAAACMTFALVVAVTETSGRALTKVMLLIGSATAPAEDRVAIVEGYLDVTSGEVPWLLATIALAMVVAVYGLWHASRDGKPSVWIAAIWLVVPPVVWFAGDAGLQTLTAAASSLP